MIEIGTSGFLFDDWVGPVYPPDLPKSEWLSHYERVLGFSHLELNSTFYTLIGAKSIERMIERTSANFRFVVKVHRALTHGPPDPRVPDRFRASLDLFRSAGRFAGALAQFPPRFLPTKKNMAAVQALHEKLGDPLFVEFRNKGWSGPFIWKWLEESKLAYCAADLPSLPALPRFTPVATADLAYLRLHGRNRAWFSDPEERYNYGYSDAEIQAVADVAHTLEKRAGSVLVFFNNCRAGHAAQDALRLRKLLDA